MRSQLLLIFLPFILLIGFLVGNLAISLSNKSAIGQGNNGRQYFAYINQQGEYYKENVLFFNDLLAPNYNAIIMSMAWANQVVHIKTEELTVYWDPEKVYDYGMQVGYSGRNYALRWFYPRPQPTPSLNSQYWTLLIIPEYEFGIWYPFDSFVKSRTDNNFYRRNRNPGILLNGLPGAPPSTNRGFENWDGPISMPLPPYSSTANYFTSYTAVSNSYKFNLYSDGNNGYYEGDSYLFLENFGSTCSYNAINYVLTASIPYTTTSPAVNPQFANAAVNLDRWDGEPTFVHLMDPRIPTDGTFFTIFNSSFSPQESILGVRWDRLLATAPLKVPPPRTGSQYSDAEMDFEVQLTTGEGVTIMNTPNRLTMPNGSDAAGQFLYDEYNLLDRRWQVVRFHSSGVANDGNGWD
jgi:hypothetical protein